MATYPMPPIKIGPSVTFSKMQNMLGHQHSDLAGHSGHLKGDEMVIIGGWRFESI